MGVEPTKNWVPRPVAIPSGAKPFGSGMRVGKLFPAAVVAQGTMNPASRMMSGIGLFTNVASFRQPGVFGLTGNTPVGIGPSAARRSWGPSCSGAQPCGKEARTRGFATPGFPEVCPCRGRLLFYGEGRSAAIPGEAGLITTRKKRSREDAARSLRRVRIRRSRRSEKGNPSAAASQALPRSN